MAKSMILESMPAKLHAVLVVDTNETELTIHFVNSDLRRKTSLEERR